MDRRERLRKLALETIDLAKVRSYSLVVRPSVINHTVRIRIFYAIILDRWNAVSV